MNLSILQINSIHSLWVHQDSKSQAIYPINDLFLPIPIPIPIIGATILFLLRLPLLLSLLLLLLLLLLLPIAILTQEASLMEAVATIDSVAFQVNGSYQKRSHQAGFREEVERRSTTSQPSIYDSLSERLSFFALFSF